MPMREISIERARQICEQKGLSPSRIKGTNGVQFAKGPTERLEIISWEDFERALEARGLAIYESGGWMKIMKKNR